MSQSTQLRVEDAVSSLLTGVTGLNLYTTNRVGSRLFPFVATTCSINSQLIIPYSGVYDLNVDVIYSDTSAKVSQASFDSAYCSIFEAFYSETPTLTTKLQNVIVSTRVHMARIISQNPTIKSDKRAWQRGLTLNVYATPQ